MPNSTLLFAYFGPETLLPVTSIVATIFGVAMMLGQGFFRWIFQFLRRGLRNVLRRRKAVAAVRHPHFQVREQDPLRTTTRP